jgi:hypothetical protein
VADVEASGATMDGELHVAMDKTDFLVVFPLHDKGRARLIGTVRQELAGQAEKLTWDDVSKRVLEWIRIDVEKVNWFSTYRVHHRVADHFRAGRAFLLGDAAHIHSPVGGQGMNTGIGDAVNLAWKLAAVLQDGAPESLLDTYEVERIAFARSLVDSTDRAFTFVTHDGPLARFVRTRLVPLVVPAIVASAAGRRAMFRRLSQIAIQYRDSALSSGCAGRVCGGDRLPWVPDNFAPLASLQWQAHVYGDASAAMRAACERAGLPLHQMPWSDGANRAGFERGALYVVRPDGYVARALPAGRSNEASNLSIPRSKVSSHSEAPK